MFLSLLGPDPRVCPKWEGPRWLEDATSNHSGIAANKGTGHPLIGDFIGYLLKSVGFLDRKNMHTYARPALECCKVDLNCLWFPSLPSPARAGRKIPRKEEDCVTTNWRLHGGVA